MTIAGKFHQHEWVDMYGSCWKMVNFQHDFQDECGPPKLEVWRLMISSLEKPGWFLQVFFAWKVSGFLAKQPIFSNACRCVSNTIFTMSLPRGRVSSTSDLGSQGMMYFLIQWGATKRLPESWKSQGRLDIYFAFLFLWRKTHVPILSMYGIFTYMNGWFLWVSCRYQSHGSYGVVKCDFFPTFPTPSFPFP